MIAVCEKPLGILKDLLDFEQFRPIVEPNPLTDEQKRGNREKSGSAAAWSTFPDSWSRPCEGWFSGVWAWLGRLPPWP